MGAVTWSDATVVYLFARAAGTGSASSSSSTSSCMEFQSFLAGNRLLAEAVRAHQIYCGGYPGQLLHTLVLQEMLCRHAAAAMRLQCASNYCSSPHVADQAHLVLPR